jgi:hypothetical protein
MKISELKNAPEWRLDSVEKLSSKAIWKGGVCKNGCWVDGVWNGGVWENGTLENGRWRNGIWMDGAWKNGFVLLSEEYIKTSNAPNEIIKGDL